MVAHALPVPHFQPIDLRRCAGPTARASLDALSSLGLTAYLGWGRQDAWLRFYNRRSRHEHPFATPPQETVRRAAPGKPFTVQRRQTEHRFRQGVATSLSVCTAPDHLAVIQPPAAACLTAHALALAQPTPEIALTPYSRRATAPFQQIPLPFRSQPLTPQGPASSESVETGSALVGLISGCPKHVNAAHSSEIEVPSVVGERSGSLRGLCIAQPELASPGFRRVGSSMFRRHRLDLIPRCFRSPNIKPNALDTTSAGGCPYEHDYGSPETSRAPRRPRPMGTTAWARPKVAFLPKRSPELLVARGRVNRDPTLLFAVAREEDFAPTPTAPSTSCREHRLFTPSGETSMKRERHRRSRRLQRRPEREGSCTPAFRDEDQRSPTPGAFRQTGARKRAVVVVSLRSVY